MALDQARSGQRGPTERGPTKRGPTERGPTERGPTERGPTKRGPTKSAQSGFDRAPDQACARKLLLTRVLLET